MLLLACNPSLSMGQFSDSTGVEIGLGTDHLVLGKISYDLSVAKLFKRYQLKADFIVGLPERNQEQFGSIISFCKKINKQNNFELYAGLSFFVRYIQFDQPANRISIYRYGIGAPIGVRYKVTEKLVLFTEAIPAICLNYSHNYYKMNSYTVKSFATEKISLLPLKFMNINLGYRI